MPLLIRNHIIIILQKFVFNGLSNLPLNLFLLFIFDAIIISLVIIFIIIVTAIIIIVMKEFILVNLNWFLKYLLKYLMINVLLSQVFHSFLLLLFFQICTKNIYDNYIIVLFFIFLLFNLLLFYEYNYYYNF